MIDPLLQALKDQKLVGGDKLGILASIMSYFECYFAAGLELGPLLESKISAIETLTDKDLPHHIISNTAQLT